MKKDQEAVQQSPPKTPATPPPSPTMEPTPKRARKNPTPQKLVLDDPEMPPLREIVPANQALVSPPIMQRQIKKGEI